MRFLFGDIKKNTDRYSIERNPTSFVNFGYICIIYICSAILLSNFTGSPIIIQGRLSEFVFYICVFFAVSYSVSIIYRYFRFGARPWEGAQFGSVAVDGVTKLILLVCLVVFHDIFTIMKNNMQHINEYGWDIAFARLDKSIHFGQDAWLWYDKLFGFIDFKILDILYLPIWAISLIGMAVHCIIFQKDRAFGRRLLITYAIIWIFLGNVVAAIFLSAGPVFFDKFTGDEGRYAELFVYQSAAGFGETSIAAVQQFLWEAHDRGLSHFGSGISAFPSLHVAITTLVMFYIGRSSKVLFFIGFLYLVIIQAASVLTGYHYAIDGYFSIIFVVILWYGYTVRPSTSKNIAQEPDAIGNFEKC